MSSTPYGEPLELLIRPSPLMATLLCLMHMAAIAVCTPLPISLAYRAAIVIGIVCAFFWNGYVFIQRTPRRLHWSPEEGWTLTDRKGTQHEVRLLPEAYLGPWLVIAHFKDERGKRMTVMLAQDSVRAEGFRRLKVLLRYGTPKR
ncbi:MAG TPA: protein YgfX [Gammaproteobacteria bacterium]|nr:protein YgfX [Gammaproteobacteria bacterium]